MSLFHRNDIRDLKIPSARDEIKKFADKHVNRTNATAQQLLDHSQDIGRLMRLKPYDLV